MSSAPAPASSHPHPPPRTRPHGTAAGSSAPRLAAKQVRYFAVAVVLLLASSAWFWRLQPLPTDPLAHPSVGSLAWWFRPIEINPALRFPSFPFAMINDTAFVGDRGWVVGANGILHTPDGGLTWVAQTNFVNGGSFTPEIPVEDYRSKSKASLEPREWPVLLAEVAPDKGRDPKQSYDTPQSKKPNLNAEPIPTPSINNAISAPEQNVPPQQAVQDSVPDPDAGWVPHVNAVTFFDANRGIAVSALGWILRTENGGKEWARIRVPVLTNGLVRPCIARTGRSEAWIAGLHPLLLHTSDAGVRWTALPPGRRPQPPNFEWSALTFLDANVGWMLGSISVTNTRLAQTIDGGLTWDDRAAPPGSFPSTLFVADRDRLWLGDYGGVIQASKDGARTWTPLLVRTNDAVADLRVLSNGWLRAMYASGIRLESRDEGATWTAHGDRAIPSGVGTEWVTLPALLSPGHDALVLRGLRGGLAVVSSNGPPRVLNANGLGSWRGGFFSDEVGCALDDRGQLYRTTDGGETWLAQSQSAAPLRVVALTIAPPNRAWAANREGRVFLSTNRGLNWTEAKSSPGAMITELWFNPDGTGWALAEYNRIFETADHGETWQPVPLPPGMRSVSHLAPAGNWITAVGMGAHANIVAARIARGDEWRIINPPATNLWGGFVESFTPEFMRFADDGLGVILGSGVMVRTNNPPGGIGGIRGGMMARISRTGTNWSARFIRMDDAVTTSARDATWVGSNRVWAVGDGGVILHSIDGGRNWTRQDAPSAAPLDRIHCVDEQHGWAFGAAQTVLRTTDGGLTWTDPRRYARYPAPAYWAFLALIGLVFVAPAIQRPPPVEADPSIANLGVSDRPLRKGEPDELALGQLAAGLSEYLRNRATTAPLTLAITGDWGSGKSSLMTLLGDELEGHGFQPVWFNAWHHQNEEHLLAALLENIRGQALPPVWKPSGFEFRWRLLTVRLRRKWLGVFFWTVILAAGAGLFLRLNQNGNGVLDALGRAAGGDVAGMIEQLFKGVALGRLAGFLAIVASLLRLTSMVKAFGVDPGKFFASVRTQATPVDLGAQTSFRFRFAREFGEVTRSLAPRRMVLFIDDLDRCDPAQVMETLQCVNFLSTSGECFIVLGMEEKATLSAVASQLAGRFENEAGRKLSEDEQVQRRWRYAGNWLEKLIQVRISIPKADDAQFERLLTGTGRPSEDANAKPSPWLMAVREVRQVFADVGSFWPAIAFALLAGLGFWIGQRFDLSRKEAPPVEVAAKPATNAPPPAWLVSGTLGGTNIQLRLSQAGTTDAVSNAPASTMDAGLTNPVVTSPGAGGTRTGFRGVAPIVSSSAGVLRPGQPARTPWGWPALIVSVLLGLGLWRLLETRRIETRDSEEFLKALKRWRGFIHQNHRTPRAVKRFINRVRFYAMLARPTEVPKETRGALEAALVAYGAIDADERATAILTSIASGGEPDCSLVPAELETDVRSLAELMRTEPTSILFRRLARDTRVM